MCKGSRDSSLCLLSFSRCPEPSKEKGASKTGVFDSDLGAHEVTAAVKSSFSTRETSDTMLSMRGFGGN